MLVFKRRVERGRVDAVIFDGVGRAHHLRVLKALDRVQHFDLHLLGHGRRKALNVEFFCIEAHGLDEELMAGLVGKADDLRLNTRAVARADALDDAGVDGTAIQILADDAVRLLRGVGQIADHLVLRRRLRRKREGQGRFVARLHLHLRKIDAARVHARRRAGLETAQRQSELFERVRQRQRGVHPVGAALAHTFADDGAPVQKCPRAEDDSPDRVNAACLGHNGGNAPVLHAKIDDLRLTQQKIFLPLERVLHHALVAPPVGLRAQRPDSRALAPVEHAVLNAG